MVQGVDTLGLINTSVTWAYPPTSLVEAQARARRQKVLEAPDVVRATGTRWYLSENGSSDNEGSAPSCPWNSLETLEENRHRIRAGDAVLFERGSIFRGCITAVSGVYYGAYGSGDKPCIYGSKKDYAGCPWEKAGENLWSLDDEFPADVVNIIFDHVAVTGYKRLHRSDLHDPCDFWSDPQDEMCIRDRWKGKWLGYYGTNSNKKFNDSVLTLLQDTWGDKKAKVSYP